MVGCPHCGGKGRAFAFSNHGPDYRTHTSGYVDCTTCGGGGRITEAHANRIARGRIGD